MTASNEEKPDDGPGNFVRDMVASELEDGTRTEVVTRFPPEPNGYLHIGHAKAITVNFGLAEEFGGRCHLRFDDTNPETEDTEFVDAIQRDVRWLGFDWGENLHFTSDYFEQLYAWAKTLVEAGKAYVDEQTPEAIRDNRGDFHRPGVDSPHRDRPVEENLALLEKMRAGEIEEGAAVLRAKIDMQSTDLKLRDPLMYRIRKATHHRTGDAWCIYPMYDWAHGQSDAIEGVTHSNCSLEFKNHRALYDWFLAQLPVADPPKQTEFARLNLSYTTLSKRRLLRLIEEGHVDGWDDPRMPTLSGMRRRGITPEAIRAFCERVGVSKRDSVVDVGLFEHAIREDLNARTPRVMAVLDPLKVVIENFDEAETIELEGALHPADESFGKRVLPLTRELYIEHKDFMKDPPKKFFRLGPGREVRLRYAALITCTDVIEDAEGNVTELRCTWDPASKGGRAPDGRRVKGTLHWVSATHAVDAEVRIFDRLFDDENPMGHEGRDYTEFLNPSSREVKTGCKLEPYVRQLSAGDRVQFERLGYYVADSEDFTADAPVFNRTITLKDTWAKMVKRGAAG
ncbi:MAG: glutamine--tRNA ligase/YqeY domain fusion protein [Sandaracinaceae bacterium]